MKVALVQMNSNEDKKRNISRTVQFIKEALTENSQFILLPEVYNYRSPGVDQERINAIVEYIPDESIIPFMEIAKRHKVYILAGSIYEKIDNSTKAYNTSILINEEGEITAKYRKIHLFDAIVGNTKIKESDQFIAGTEAVLAKIKKFNAGISICYDLRFPELYRKYFYMGANILCIPSSFTKPTGTAHWEILLRARAIENLCYVLAPNQVGIDNNGVESYGNSMVINPWGEIIARASENNEEIIYCDIHEKQIRFARRRLPSLKNRKFFNIL
jgi:predicted amidohydrolase